MEKYIVSIVRLDSLQNETDKHSDMNYVLEKYYILMAKGPKM